MAIWIDDLLFTVDRHTVSQRYGIWYYLLVVDFDENESREIQATARGPRRVIIGRGELAETKDSRLAPQVLVKYRTKAILDTRGNRLVSLYERCGATI